MSFSNLFKEFKSTSTWLQFPFRTADGEGGGAGGEGPDASPTRWTFLSLNMKEILSRYLLSNFSYLKNVKLCSSMLVKNAFTSDVEYSPLAVAIGNKHGQCLLQLPRDMSLPLQKDMEFLDVYDYVCFPSAEKKLALLSEQRRQLKGMKAGSEGMVLVSQPKKGEGTKRGGHVTKAKAGSGGDGNEGLKSSDHVTKVHYHVVRDSEPSGGEGEERGAVIGSSGHVTQDLVGSKLVDHSVVVVERHPSKSPRGERRSGNEGEGGRKPQQGGEGEEGNVSEGSVHVHGEQGTELAIHRGNQSKPERIVMQGKPTVGHSLSLSSCLSTSQKCGLILFV